jgi:hypothetical protein
MNYEEKKAYFIKEISRTINSMSLENLSDTPDFILAESLWEHLISSSKTIFRREVWYGRKVDAPGDSGTNRPLSPKGERDL